MSELRFGVVGLGSMGRHHARVLQDLEGVSLVGVCDPAGDVHGVARHIRCAGSVAEMVSWGIDAAAVAVPTEDHLSVGLELAAAGVHMLVEKPLAHSVEAGEELAQAFDDAHLIAAVGHVERFNPAVRSLKVRLEQGDLGEIYQIATSRQGPFPDRVRDVGVVKDLATHDIDIAAWVANSGFESVSARVTHRAGRPHEDLVAVVGRLHDETVVNHLVNWLTPMKQRQVTVTGERGCFVADTLTADLTFFANGKIASEWDAISKFRGVSEGDMVRFAIAKPEPLRTEIMGFRDTVAGRIGEIVPASEGLETLRVADAITRAAARGTVELIP